MLVFFNKREAISKYLTKMVFMRDDLKLTVHVFKNDLYKTWNFMICVLLI